MIIFASIFGVGFGVLVLSLIFGSDADIDVDADIDLDLDHGGPSIFGAKMIALLMVGFGAAGFGMRATTDVSMSTASLTGVGGALLMGVIGYVILRAFYASQASSTITNQDILGQTGNLLDGINGDRYGQVACVIGGREILFLARSEDAASIERGTPVRITAKAGNVVTVQKIENKN
ncbi:MAG: hypothetical protein KKA42_04320 [candidate division Zixibacteria bacterium]|nr:hypothetical protein [candidate division Zixibacteria bacterium]